MAAMTMRNPPHPGQIIRSICEEMPLTITDAAAALGVTRQALNNVVNEKATISPEMAIRLEKAFGSTADMWLRLQAAYDAAQARAQFGHLPIKRYKPKTKPSGR